MAKRKPTRSSGRLKRAARKQTEPKPQARRRRRPIPYHQLGRKKNLVVDEHLLDTYPCVRCGKEFKYRLGRPSKAAGECMVSPEVYAEWEAEQAKEKAELLGWWHNEGAELKCSKCGAKAKLVPRKGHELSDYWKHERDDGAKLVYCTAGCTIG